MTDKIDEVDQQVNLLQNKLKDRLKQTQDLSDLNNDVFKSTMKIEKSTARLKETAVKTKWYWFWEWFKWACIAFAIATVIILILLNKMGFIGKGSTTTINENNTENNNTENTENTENNNNTENNTDNNNDNG
ncbi:hypothetical protein EHP00_2069 [Ecytonucleospora hepatopenaei]|uniref:V-SNARE coiled-coil homology domain-containing protein n=1 Tax=Ecytonucleospora hepatopenaei TaxID=646526 RepID=A0A1W0E396_9MICR|nr:hypothetical protein EHP00_2069 [Ecytonucleospora hepatopenaei]